MKTNLKEMWREHRMLLVLTSAIILLQMLVGVLLWDRLPDPMATHFNFQNEPDGWSSKPFAVFGMPLVLLGLHLMCLLLSCASNIQMQNISSRVKILMLLIIPAASLLATVLCYGYALGAPFAIDRIVWVFVGVVFALVGNYLPKMRRSTIAGIRLPWTLADEEIWNRTHRFAAPVWVLCGLLLIVCGLIGSGPMIPVAAVVAVIGLPIAYSLVVNWRKYRA
ncbi:MAG: SdpI family protein [Candidatus Ventricola sp.]